jgi:hypothetical protein
VPLRLVDDLPGEAGPDDGGGGHRLYDVRRRLLRGAPRPLRRGAQGLPAPRGRHPGPPRFLRTSALALQIDQSSDALGLWSGTLFHIIHVVIIPNKIDPCTIHSVVELEECIILACRFILAQFFISHCK